MILTFFNVDVGVEKYWDSSFCIWDFFVFMGFLIQKRFWDFSDKENSRLMKTSSLDISS